jgi:hypothetical protein
MGQNEVTFWDRRGQLMVTTKQILALNKVIFGTGEVDFGSLQDELRDIMMCFFGIGEVDIWVIMR